MLILRSAFARSAGSDYGGMNHPGFAALTPGFMPPSAPQTVVCENSGRECNLVS